MKLKTVGGAVISGIKEDVVVRHECGNIGQRVLKFSRHLFHAADIIFFDRRIRFCIRVFFSKPNAATEKRTIRLTKKTTGTGSLRLFRLRRGR